MTTIFLNQDLLPGWFASFELTVFSRAPYPKGWLSKVNIETGNVCLLNFGWGTTDSKHLWPITPRTFPRAVCSFAPCIRLARALRVYFALSCRVLRNRWSCAVKSVGETQLILMKTQLCLKREWVFVLFLILNKSGKRWRPSLTRWSGRASKLRLKILGKWFSHFSNMPQIRQICNFA